MKKKASFLKIDTPSLDFLIDLLESNKDYTDEVHEVYDEFKELKNKRIDSVIIHVGSGTYEDSRSYNYEFDDLVINTQNRTVSVKGENVLLTPKEFDILCFLAEHQGIVFTKEQIYEAVWNEEYYLSDSNIMAFIRKLRKKIEPNPDDPKYIITIWGVGYKFNDKL